MRDDHAEGASLDGEGDGERADVFAVEFEGVRRAAGEPDVVAAKPSNVAGPMELIRQPTPAKLEERRHIGARPDHHFELAILQVGTGKDRDASAIETSIADEDEFAGGGVNAVGDGELRKLAGERAEAGGDVGERADLFFVLPVHQFDGARVEARAGQLREVTADGFPVEGVFGGGQIDAAFAARADDSPGIQEIHGQAEFLGEDVDGAEGQHAETDARERVRHIAEAVEDFVDGAVAAGGDDGVKALAHGLGGESASGSGGGGGLEGALMRESGEVLLELPRLVAARDGVEDDAGVHEGTWGVGRGA